MKHASFFEKWLSVELEDQRFGAIAIGLAVTLVGFHMWNAFAGLIPNLITRPAHLALALPWIFVIGAAARQGRAAYWSGWAFLAIGLTVCVLIMLNRRDLIQQYGALNGPVQIALAGALIVVVLEMARRAIKIVLPAVATIVLAYAFFGAYIPGKFGHGGMPVDYLLGTLTITEGGLWGTLTGTSVDTIAMFVILGGFISAGQAGAGFMSFATQIAGRARAGAAKVAILSSAFYGSISGVAAANTASTGMITIPTMKRLGYPPQLAAATEAVASTGGQILPPVMGAGIFVMAELVRVPYTEIMVAALLPAILFFMAAWFGVHVYALRTNLAALPKDALPGWGVVARSVPFFLLPFSILVGTLVFTSYTLAYAAVFATVVTWVTLIFDADGTVSLQGWYRRTLVAVVTAAQQVAIIAAVIVCAGIVVGVFNMTGLGVKLTSLILSASDGRLWIALLLTALAALVLGMELPTTAAYVICAAVAAPALVGMGLPDLQAHLFVFWYALLCTITPPVCGNVFIAAAIAKTPWLPVAGNAMRLGVGLFIIPLGFIANPEILDLATMPFAALAAMAQIALGLWLISFAVIGAARQPLLELLRLPALPAGLAVIFLL
ncbi:TRAP transporter fused permease subunit [Roseinatronobacter sp. S2]|uniref:TRAP transporter permease n=1 Tax=Roseinatronobacter sp. S2 TaxID=3035471 RepID=UPI0024100702|nr:TRAP transporter fused permease subunit [Roseinatronobacter sp. S2]WFE77023.1 TRAP transporter fused permease subunit [Roseinatronobacter sp. S2]